MSTSIIVGFDTYVRIELGLSLETHSAYMRDVKEFLDFIMEQKLTARLIEKFVGHLRQRGLKPNTIRRKCMSIRCLCHHLISLGQLDPNILDMIDSIRINRRKPNALDCKDVDILISTVEKRIPLLRTINVRRDVAIILTLCDSGLRASELCNLDKGDINFTRRAIRVKGKGGHERIVPTTERCVLAIRNYMNLDRESNINSVFVKTDGQRITRRAISDMLMSLARRAGVKHTTSHMLRRTCATELMNNGMDIECVQALLGHRHISTTQDYLATNIDRLKAMHVKCHPFGEKCEI